MSESNALAPQPLTYSVSLVREIISRIPPVSGQSACHSRPYLVQIDKGKILHFIGCLLTSFILFVPHEPKKLRRHSGCADHKCLASEGLYSSEGDKTGH